jgi:outer membrane receptor protein involved in Fe transport
MELGTNAYYYDFTDMTVQFSAFDTVQLQDALAFFNLGKAESYGFNVSGTYLLGDRDALTFNLDYLGSKILEFDYDEALAEFKSDIYEPNPGFDWTGFSFANTTPWRLTVGWDRTMQLASGTFSSRVQGVWNDDRYYQYRDDTLVQPKFDGWLVDSHITLDWNINYRPDDSDWFVGAYVSNITDKIVPASLGSRTPNGTLAAEPVPNGATRYLSGSLRPGRRFGIRFGYDF